MEPTAAAREEARRHPGEQVYAIEGNYGPNDYVPPEAIAGCWKVDANGEIVGEFIPNPNYQKKKRAKKSLLGFLRSLLNFRAKE